MLEPGQRFPDVEKKNAETPPEEWRNGPNGLQGPWEARHLVHLINPATMDHYTFSTATIRGAIAVRELANKVKWGRKFHGHNAFRVVLPPRFCRLTKLNG